MSKAPKYGKWVYCIIGTKRKESFGPMGMGERGDEVHTLHYRDLAAVVSDCPFVKYPVSRENSLAHQRVIEKVNERHAVLPVRYGTIADSEEQVPEILKVRYDEFKSTLKYVADKTELGVKAVWKDGLIFWEIVEESPAIRSLKAQIEGHPPEKTHYQRIKIGELVEAALQAKREREGWEILKALVKLSVDHRENRILHDRMLLNAAFLVAEKDQAAFDEEMNRLGAKRGARMEFRYIGPIAPFNFVEIFIDFDELKAAKVS
ncbi:MAG: GvpL/GvpF family gas vesicle protein [Nitrospinota bacterium]